MTARRDAVDSHAWGDTVGLLPGAVDGGPIALPFEVLVAWGAGLLALVTIIVGTSAVRPRASNPDPLVDEPGHPDPADFAKPWSGPSNEADAFDSGRELARHMQPRSVEAAVRQWSTMGANAVRVEDGSDGALILEVDACASCREGASVWGRRERRVARRFEEGYLTGAFETVLDATVEVSPARCSKNSGPCTFVVRRA